MIIKNNDDGYEYEIEIGGKKNKWIYLRTMDGDTCEQEIVFKLVFLKKVIEIAENE